MALSTSRDHVRSRGAYNLGSALWPTCLEAPTQEGGVVGDAGLAVLVLVSLTDDVCNPS